MSKSLQLQRFGQNVRAARKMRNLSQEELAERCQLHRTYIGGIERGERNVALLNILKIAKALDIAPGQLLEGVSAD